MTGPVEDGRAASREGVNPLGVPLRRDPSPEQLATHVPLRPSPSRSEWLAWWRSVRGQL